MTAFAIVFGKLWRVAETRTSTKSGKTFAVATLREGGGDAAVWWSIIGFGDNAEELLRLHDGDALAVSGPFTVETYAKDGETKLRHRITANRIASPRLSGRQA